MNRSLLLLLLLFSELLSAQEICRGDFIQSAFGINFFWSHKKTEKLVDKDAERLACVSYEKKSARNCESE
jgi:hypothetical protein